MTRLVEDERGAGAVLVLAAGLAVLTAAGLVVGLGGAALARHRAETAADLGALAGAAVAARGSAAACAAAAEVVAANHARLTACHVQGLVVEVVAEVEGPRGVPPLPGLREARGRARAGPAEPGAAAARLTGGTFLTSPPVLSCWRNLKDHPSLRRSTLCDGRAGQPSLGQDGAL